MRTIRWGVLAALLAACGESPTSAGPDGGPAGVRDAAPSPGADAGPASGTQDAAALAAPDAAAPSPADAGSASPRDGGRGPTCELEGASAAVKLTGFQQAFELADLTAGDGRIAFAYSWNQLARKLQVVEAATGAQVADGALANIDGLAIPRALDYAGGLYFVAGNFDDTASSLAPYTRVAYYDEAGSAKAWSEQQGFLAIAAAREAAGARVLAWGKAVAGETPVYLNRHDLAGALLDSSELGRNARRYNEWDLEWRAAEDRGMACGLIAVDGAEKLAVWPMAAQEAGPAPVATAVTIPASADQPSFGCRLSLGKDTAAVAVADGVGGARLIWISSDGSTLAGPVPFSTFKRAAKYDVAVGGGLTALAHLDESTGTPRVAIKVFPSPAGTPIELSAEADLNLGPVDFVGRKVRLARVEGGFAVAFDANIKLGQTDLYVRRVLCQ